MQWSWNGKEADDKKRVDSTRLCKEKHFNAVKSVIG